MFIKATFKGQKRKFKVEDKGKFADVVQQLVRCFGEDVRGLEIGYIDDENEFIRVCGDEEWEVCVEEFKFRNSSKDINTIEIMVTDKQAITAIENSQSFVSVQHSECARSESAVEDFKLINSIKSQQEMSEVESVSESPKVGESIPIPHFVNPTNEDIVFNLDIKGTPEELLKIQQTITHHFAPHAGFELEKAILKQDGVEKDLTEPTENSKLNNSTLSTEQVEEIESIIDAKLAKLNFKKTNGKVSSGNYDHGGVTCDNCNTYIKGCARFKSLVNYDYDLCETCEASGVHPGPMIKIREPIGFQLGMKLNAEFNYLKNLFENKPAQAPVETPKPAPCAPAPARSLCHIRQTPKQTEECKPNPTNLIKEADLALKKVAQVLTKKTEEIKAANPKIQETINNISKMFKNVDGKTITEFVSKNSDKSAEEMINLFIDKYVTKQ